MGFAAQDRRMKAAMIPSSNTHGALSPDLMQGCRRQALAIGGQPLQQACWRGRRAQRGAKSGEGRGDSCGIFLASLQQKGIGALNFYALTGELADAEVSDVLGDEADDLGAGIEVTGQDRRCAGGDVDVPWPSASPTPRWRTEPGPAASGSLPAARLPA